MSDPTRPLDRTKPPPGWSHNFAPADTGEHMLSRPAPVTTAEHAWSIYNRESAPAVSEAVGRVVAWLRESAERALADDPSAHGVCASQALDDAADAIEAGAWKR